MNVVFFHDSRFKYDNDSYYATGGLNSKVLAEYLNYFDDVTICARKNKILKNEDLTKFSKIELEKCSFSCVTSLKNAYFKERKQIKRNVENHDFAIIRMPSFIGIIAFFYVKLLHKPHLIEMVACPYDSLNNYGKLFYKILAPLVMLINKLIVSKADNVIYVSNEFLQKRYPNKKNNIGCSDVRIEKCENTTLANRIDKIENYNENTIYKFGLIGSLNVNFKGHETAIKSLAKLKDSLKFELHFLGYGTEERKEYWKQFAKECGIEERVFFDGTLPGGKAVFDWMDNLDIYLIPSLQEGLPRALVEAMSRSLVCIGVKTGGIPELLDKSVVFERNDDAAIAEYLGKLIKNKKELIKQAELNFNKAKEFETEKLLQKKKKFYETILSKIKK